MIYLLYILSYTGSANGGTSIQSREFQTKEACEFVATSVNEMVSYGIYVKTKCIGIKK